MPDIHTLMLFAGASLVLYISPGPDMLHVANRAMADGIRGGMLAALGVSAGLVVHMLAAAFGLAAVLVIWPIAFTLVKWLGAAYLLYLGVTALMGRGSAARPTGGMARAGSWRLFRQGFLVNLLNPKIALFFMAFLPQFASQAPGANGVDQTLQILILGALFNTGSLVWLGIQTVTFARIGRWLSARPRILLWQRRVSGVLLIALAGRLAVAER
ncbi:LysE family translocator [Marivibrio halodurans]|uniref:LysE family translocator n=1 Tax=Marivibrio halodurans TaxID=2039722 RepID=A0A8J7SJM7_9PROT|nr:LysE family translocator [Marivibrio halodurans]MBP5857858.1 LysE family translocator [Marivibrio halodurans]